MDRVLLPPGAVMPKKESGKLFCVRLTGLGGRNLFMNFIGSKKVEPPSITFEESDIILDLMTMRYVAHGLGESCIFPLKAGRLLWASGERKYIDLVLNVAISEQYYHDALKWNPTFMQLIALHIFKLRQMEVWRGPNAHHFKGGLMCDFHCHYFTLLKRTNFMNPSEVVAVFLRPAKEVPAKRSYEEERRTEFFIMELDTLNKRLLIGFRLSEPEESFWFNDDTLRVYGAEGVLLVDGPFASLYRP